MAARQRAPEQRLIQQVLQLASRHARWVLVLGLLAGLLFQSVAAYTRPTIPLFIAALLFLAAFRIGPAVAFADAASWYKQARLVLICQLLVPVVAMLPLLLLPEIGVYATALLLVLAAAPISGSPNLVIMLGFAPDAALRQLIVGTALLPLTILPVLYFLPQLEGPLSVLEAALRLLLIILLAACTGFLCRRLSRFQRLTANDIACVDGLSAICMAMVVVGLMSAIGDAWRQRPADVVYMMLFAFAVNFGLQLLGSWFWPRVSDSSQHVSMTVISGNRNVALFLAALPATVMNPLLVFVGCYQFPMYLTPLLLKGFYRLRYATRRS